MGLGMLLSGLSAGGNAVAANAEQDTRMNNDRTLMNERLAHEKMLIGERARIEEEKQLNIDKVRQERTREAGIRQGSEITAESQRAMNERDAAAINAREGSSMTAEDAQALRNSPDARKAYGLTEATRQSDLENRANAAEQLGYLDAAKEIRGQIRNEVLDTKNSEQIDLANKREDRLLKFQEESLKRQDQNARQSAAYQSQALKAQSDRDAVMNTREQRSATSKALDGVNSLIAQTNKEIKDTFDPNDKKELIGKLKILQDESMIYRKSLAGAGLEGSVRTSPEKPFDDEDFAIGGNKAAARHAKKPAENAKPESAQQVAKAQPRQEGIDVSNDPVLMSLKKSMSEIDATDPRNVQKIMAFGKARNDRISQLQEKYGSLSRLVGY